MREKHQAPKKEHRIAFPAARDGAKARFPPVVLGASRQSDTCILLAFQYTMSLREKIEQFRKNVFKSFGKDGPRHVFQPSRSGSVRKYAPISSSKARITWPKNGLGRPPTSVCFALSTRKVMSDSRASALSPRLVKLTI